MRRRHAIVVVAAVSAVALAMPAQATRHPEATRPRVGGIGSPTQILGSTSTATPPVGGRNPAVPSQRPARPAPGAFSGTSTNRQTKIGTLAPVIGAFDSDLVGPIGSLSPADPTGATGPASVVAAVNVKVSVYDRTGAELLAPLRLRSIDPRLHGLTETDPKVVYDQYDGVFVLAFLTYNDRQGYIDVVTIPDGSAEQQDTWCVRHIVGDQFSNGRHEFADYPSLAFTSDRVTVTTNNFGFSSGVFRYAQVISMPKSALYDPECPRNVPRTVVGGAATRNPDGSQAFTLQAAPSVGGPSSDQYFVSLEPKATFANLVLWRLAGDSTALTKTAKRVKRALLPPYGYQCHSTGSPNTWWDTGDLRLTSAFFDAGKNRLYAATSALGNAGGGPPESVIRWYEAQPAGKLGQSTILQQGTIGSPDHDAAWPAIATNDAGTLFVTYARAGLSECLSVYAATVPAGTSSASVSVVRTGDARYEWGRGVERWGDFSAANRDPLAPAGVAVFGAVPVVVNGGKPTRFFISHGALLTDSP
jgi:hypothetical protein